MPQTGFVLEESNPFTLEEERPATKKTDAKKPAAPPPNQDEAVEGYGASKEALEQAGHFAAGAVRGAVSTVQGLASPIRRAFGMQPATPPPTETTGAGKAGRAVEQVGEFLLPGVGAEGAVSKIPAASKLVRAGVRAGAEGAGALAIAKGQGDEHPYRTAALSFALAPLSEFGKTVAGATKASAVKSTEKALSRGADPTDKAFERAVQDSANRVLDLGISPTWRKMLQKADAAKGATGQALQTELAGAGGQAVVPTQPILDALDALSEKAQNVVPLGKRGQPIGAGPTGSAQALATVTFNKRLVKQIDSLKQIIAEHGPSMTAQQMHNIKEDWSAFVWQSRKFAKPKLSLEAKAKDAASRAMREVFEKDAPTISDLDQQYHLARQTYDVIAEAAGYGSLTPAEQAAKAQTAKRANQIAAGAAAAVGGATYYAGHSPAAAALGAVVGGATARLLETAMQSPGWRLLKPAAKNALADAIASGRSEEVRRIIAPLLASTAAGSSSK